MRKAVTTSLFGVLGIGLMAGCPDRTISEVNPEQGRVEFKDIPVNLNRNVDILFVIDDSGSMADKQANLRNNFPNFINVLNTIQGGLPDVHIGVISSDMGTKAEDGTTANPVGTVGSGGCGGSGDDGRLQLGTATGITGTFLSDIKLTDGSRQKNYTGDLSQTFQAMASIGATGCGFEQHLSAMKRALDPNNTANSGFVRSDAFLAVIILADEDDCSMSHSTLLGPDGGPLGPQQSFRCTRFGVKCDTGGADDGAMNVAGHKEGCHPDDGSAHVAKVSEFIDFLKSRKDDPSKVITAAIVGLPVSDECDDNGVCGLTNIPGAPLNSLDVENRSPSPGAPVQPALKKSCVFQSTSGKNEADPAIRISTFLSGFPNRNTITTICQNDLSGGLTQIGELLKAAIGNPCIEGDLADVDPETPGEQFECSASVVTNFGKPNAEETIIPECATNGGAEPCWHLDVDMANCPNSDHLIFVVDGQENLPPDAHMLVNCVTEVGPSP